jgi:5'-3' exonuclease
MIDTDNLVLRHLYKSKGKDSNFIIKNILASIKKYIDMFEADMTFACADSGRSKYRLEIYPEYKGNRNKNLTDEDKIFLNFKKSVKDELLSTLSYLSIPTIQSYGIEADDIIAFIDKYSQNARKYIVSSDQDFYQLVNSNTTIYNPIKDYTITPSIVVKENKFIEKKDIKRFFIVKKCILGDNSDNIPNIAGFGPVKTAALLERMFTNKLNEKDKEILLENQDKLKLNKALVHLGEFPKEYQDTIYSEIKKSLKIVERLNEKDFVVDLEDRYSTKLSYTITNIKDNFNINKEKFLEDLKYEIPVI